MYNWIGARIDLNNAKAVTDFYNVGFDDMLDMWMRTHEVLLENWDLVERAAEKLFIDRVLLGEWVEENMLLTPGENINR